MMIHFEKARKDSWVLVVFSVASIFLGLIISLQSFLISLILGGMLAASLLFLYRNIVRKTDGNWFAIGSVACLLILPLAAKIFNIRLFGIWQLAIIFGGLLGVPILLHQAKNNSILKWSLFLFVLYCFAAIASTVNSGRLNTLAFLYQAASNLKPLLLVSFCFFAWSRLSSQLFLWRVINFTWIYLVFFIAFEWAMPGLYFSIFGAIAGASPDPNGIFPSRAVGPFEHPSVLASISASFLMLSAARAVIMVEDRNKYSLLALKYLFCLICSIQRQELAGALIVIFLLLFLAKNIRWTAWHLFAIFSSITLIPVLSLIFADDFYREAGQWGIGTVSEISHPRAQQYDAAFSIANERFPFGSGLGTFGGAGAEKFDLSLYYEMGFARYWWFGKQDYLLDTFWPNSIAEGGWIGFFFLVGHFFLLGLYGIVNARTSSVKIASVYWIFSGLGVWYLLVSAFTSPSYQDPRLFYWIALGFALAKVAEDLSDHERIA